MNGIITYDALELDTCDSCNRIQFCAVTYTDIADYDALCYDCIGSPRLLQRSEA